MEQNGSFLFHYKQKWVIFPSRTKTGYFHKAGLSIRICQNTEVGDTIFLVV